VERDKKAKSSASSQKSKKASKSTSRKTNLRSEPAGEQLEQLEPPQENSEEAKQRLLKEKREDGVHSSQQKIQVVGLNG
jgi:TFIIF-interacting CTD phosphatase-like protein